MRKILNISFLCLFVFGCLTPRFGFSYTRDWDEADPIDHTLNRNWPDEIRDVKEDVGDRLTGQVYGFTSGESTEGVKKLMFVDQVSNPSTVTDKILLYGKAVSSKTELFIRDEDGNAIQLTSGGKVVSGMSGEVRMWYGLLANIPTGWQVCDGTNSTPDLRGKLVPAAAAATEAGSVSGDSYVVAHTHTGPSHTHTIDSHTHSLTYKNAGDPWLQTTSDGSSTSASTYTAGSGVLTSNASGTGNTGSAGTASLYALIYICK